MPPSSSSTVASDGRAPSIADAVHREVEIAAPESVDGAAPADAVEAADVVVTCTLRATLGISPTVLWSALRCPEELRAWYGPVSGEFEVGGRFATPGASGRIVACDAPHRLRLTWEYGDNVDDLRLRLDPEDDGTSELRLRHTARVPHEIFDRFGPGAMAVGWDIALLGLVAHTGAWEELGLDVPAPTPAWLASDEGAALVRAWSIRWAAASVAAGTDEESARRGEIETTRAYGGERDALAV